MVGQTRLLARTIGLCVAATAAVVATHFLSLGFEATPLLNPDRVEALTSWIRRTPNEGVGILAAVGLALVGVIALVGLMWPQQGPAAMTTRRRGGWTRIDRASLAGAIERHLERLDSRNDVTARIGRRGSVDIEITTTDLAVDGPGAELKSALDEYYAARSLPCRTGTVSIRPRNRPTRRQTIR